MNNLFKPCLGFAFLLFGIGGVNAQSASADASAVLVTGIQITKQTDLHFGTMTVPSNASAVVLSTANARSVSTGDITLLANAPTSSVATFAISGNGSQAYSVTLPNSVNITESAGGSNTMEITNFTEVSASGNHTLSVLGADVVTVGGTLVTGTDEISGTYAGTFNVTVAYN